MGNQIIALLASADENYAVPMAVALHSALFHLSKTARAEVFIADSGITPATKARCAKTLRAAHPNMDLHWYRPDLSEFAGIDGGHLTEATFSRIFVSEIVPEDIDRVLYIDCDVVVGDDISKLWDIDMTGTAFMCALDGPGDTFDMYIRDKFPEVIAPPETPYFNSGVMLVNLPEWRRREIMIKARDFISRHGHALTHMDQCALNAVGVGAWKPLDDWWNTQVAFNLGRTLPGYGILHYTTHKPWVRSAQTAMADQYFQAYRRARIEGPIIDWIKTTELATAQAYCHWKKRAAHRSRRRLNRWMGNSA
ncbi:glycosyltransferase family 8 protein [Yoonia sp. I 8.24]|uniref:glycosyltransferase family 8 protein n=1 Tax=Yoonia sp. I 8.24 TaxID=1537229 RepID=UPI001EDD3FC5|nr:glycosyltransferase family 8 protein [Yoonia sp. I 8.24]MCG3266948.1 glycosyltransferase family 8 protein [Yoonia sp. I 8.24]